MYIVTIVRHFYKGQSGTTQLSHMTKGNQIPVKDVECTLWTVVRECNKYMDGISNKIYLYNTKKEILGNTVVAQADALK